MVEFKTKLDRTSLGLADEVVGIEFLPITSEEASIYFDKESANINNESSLKHGTSIVYCEEGKYYMINVLRQKIDKHIGAIYC